MFSHSSNLVQHSQKSFNLHFNSHQLRSRLIEERGLTKLSLSLKIVTVSLFFLLCVSTFVLPSHLQTTEAASTSTYSNGTLINALYNLTASTNWSVGPAPWGYSIPWSEYSVDMLAVTIQTGVNTASSVSSMIDNSGSPQVILYWYSV